MEYCCHVWADTPKSCYSELLDELRNWILENGNSPEPLAHGRNVTNLSLFYRHYFGGSSSELAQLVQCPYS